MIPRKILLPILLAWSGLSVYAQAAIETTASLDGSTIGVRFTQEVQSWSAQNSGYYTVSGASVWGATLRPDGRTVVLSTGGISGASFTVTVNGVTDVNGSTISDSAAGSVMGLTAEDIGWPVNTGRAFAADPDLIEVTAGGRDIWGTFDAFHYVHQQRTGDFDVRARVTHFEPNADAYAQAKAGLMVRETLDQGSRHTSVVVYPRMRNWTAFQRAATHGASSVLTGNWRISWPEEVDFPEVWVRIRRTGDTFYTYGSSDGDEWVLIGNPVTRDYAETVYIGTATVSLTDTHTTYPLVDVGYAEFGDFAIVDGGIEIVQHPVDTTVSEGSTALFSVSASATGTSDSNLIYQWQKNGQDIPGATLSSYTTAPVTNADSGSLYRVVISLPGGTFVVSEGAVLTVSEDVVPPEIVSTASLNGQTIGVCFSELLDVASAENPVNYSLGGGATVVSATLMPNGSSVKLEVSGLTGDSYLLIVSGVRDLSNNVAETAAEGTVWGVNPHNVGSAVYVGNSFSCAEGVVLSRAGGTDIWGSADGFHFAYQEREGDFDIQMQIARMVFVVDGTRGGLMVRESLDANSRNFFIGTYSEQSSSNRWLASRRAITGGSTALAGPQDLSFQIRASGFAFPNAWFRLVREGETFTGFRSTNGENWVQLGEPFTISQSRVYVGLATLGRGGNTNPEVHTTIEFLNFGDVPELDVTVPQLRARRDGTSIALSWPESAAGYVLFESDNLTDWVGVSAEPVIVDGEATVTLPIEGNRKFYRLQR
jgi:hypothetical protein